MADREEAQGPVELLRSVPLFADLEEGELERFSRVAVARSFPAGTRVFHEGDHSDACYIVRDGSFRVTREHSDGRAITLATLGPGDIFGELAMLDGEVRSASVEALDDGELRAAQHQPAHVRPEDREHVECVDRLDRRRAALVVEHRQLAEDVARAERRQRDLAAVGVLADRSGMAGADEVARVRLVAFAEDHLARGEAPRVADLGHQLEVRRRQRREDRHLAEQLDRFLCARRHCGGIYHSETASTRLR